MSYSQWFGQAMRSTSGDEFAVCDIMREPMLNNAAVAIYSTAIRCGGETKGEPIGALGIFFDWEPQAQAIVHNVALTEEERRHCRVMLLNADFRVIASSDNRGLLTERYPLDVIHPQRGYYRKNDRLVSYALTPGYETYDGLGWYGCIETDQLTTML